MLYKGRNLDPVALWQNYIDLPANFSDDGSEFSGVVMCPNPDHDARKPHFQINLRRPLCHCFSNCGISGTYERAISIIEGCTEKEARKVILQHCSISGRKDGGSNTKSQRHRVSAGVGGKRRADDKDENVSLDFSTYIPQVGLDYLDRRAIDGSSIALWTIGYDANERRIVIPANDDRGIRRFLIKRSTREQDWPKYLYWPEKEQSGWGKQDILFGACHLDKDVVRSDGLIMVEGSLDCIRLHQHGFRNVVAILGSSVSERQREIASKFRPSKITLMFDKDVSGFHAVQSAYRLFSKCPLFVAIYPKGRSDPAEMSREEVGRAIERSISIVKYNEKLPRNLKLGKEHYAKIEAKAR